LIIDDFVKTTYIEKERIFIETKKETKKKIYEACYKIFTFEYVNTNLILNEELLLQIVNDVIHEYTLDDDYCEKSVKYFGTC